MILPSFTFPGDDEVMTLFNTGWASVLGGDAEDKSIAL